MLDFTNIGQAANHYHHLHVPEVVGRAKLCPSWGRVSLEVGPALGKRWIGTIQI